MSKFCTASIAAVALVLTLASTVDVEAGGTQLSTRRIASGLSEPVFVTAPPGDYERLFIVEKQGRIRILNLRNKYLRTTPFLNIASQVWNYPNERGLLGLAFHPDYANNGYFYVNFISTGGSQGTSVVRRYTVSATNPNVANAGSAYNILSVPQPDWNHNGCTLAFGPIDGYLYISLGDGGGGGDTYGNSQNMGSMLAKMLRIDVDGGSPYAVPATNPFVGPGNPLDEIWLTGLRNAWRYSFDRVTGDMFIGDVGQNAWEEVDFHAATSPGGANFGWRCMEGNHCYGSSLPGCTCNSGTLTDPIWEYSLSGGRCSVIGGYVYRGMTIPDLDGVYFFGDYCTGQTWSFVYNGSTMTGYEERTFELDPPGPQSIDAISSYGEDAMGEIYVCDLLGEVYKIVPSNIGALDCNGNYIVDTVEFSVGLAEDCNSNGEIDDCEITAGTADDCDGNGEIDSCEFTAGTAVDCNGNGVIDFCDIAAGTADDCDGNGVIDDCELAAGTAEDCNGNDNIDSCDVAVGIGHDCNTNQIPDDCEVASGVAGDCDMDGLLDECEIFATLEDDCNSNKIPDSCEIDDGTELDCNGNGKIDSCDISLGVSEDLDSNGVPDECEVTQFIRGDCNVDGSVNVADAITTLDYLFNPAVTTVACEDSCDANDDGGLNISDPIYALDALFGGGGPLPQPWPGCGQDPTADALLCDQFGACP